ncbi:lefty2 [Chanos chanos]|uniref:Left-right determination factor n=1 Tax=Chanos chanos TaxID=29144 RepID=A0A6J2UT13_CHACN|nr:left-right determination factor 1-like [Chanos chanos]
MEYLFKWLLCAALFSVAHCFSTEDIKEAMLQKLGMTEPPRIQKRDLENLVVPTHIKNKYLSMLKFHNKRRRRSVPSLAGILRGIHGSADIEGEIMYSDTTRQRLAFDMEARIRDNSEVTMAELKLYKTAPPQMSLTAKKSHRPVNNARVSIYWVEVSATGSNRTSLVDSRLVPIHETGWTSFDVTQAIHYWSKTQRNIPLHLEVWIEGERPGSYAAEMARSVRFASQNPKEEIKDKGQGKPDLVLYTLSMDEFGSRGDCKSSTAIGMCCREEHFINFRELTWTQFWIIEPAGYQAFRCIGGCKQPVLNYGYGRRSCAVAESAPLPIMYLVKRGDHTEIEVAEFPNMIVEKCGCSVDNVSNI